MNLEFFIFGLLIISTLTSLSTEAIKKILVEHEINYYSNTLVGIISLVLSIATGTGYAVVTGVGFDKHFIVYIVALVFMSWLCAMIGYDKVVQAISQFKTQREDDIDE